MPTTPTEVVPTPLPPISSVPPLIDGDRMDADEFWRRYVATEDKFKAELIDGVVYVSSPVSPNHGNPTSRVASWLGRYCEDTPAVEAFIDTTVRVGPTRTPQPDLCLQRYPPRVPTSPEAGGTLVATPDFAVEIAVSSVRVDTGPKLRMYESAGTLEYMVWRVEAGVIDWWTRDGDRFVELRPDADGISRSRAFPGLWLDAAAMLRRDRQAVTRALQAGLATAEHTAFVELGRLPDSLTPGVSQSDQ